MITFSLDHFQQKLVRKPFKNVKRIGFYLFWVLFTIDLATDNFAQKFSSYKFNNLPGPNRLTLKKPDRNIHITHGQ